MDTSLGTHEDIPMLYRSILTLLGELERQAAHAEASRIRLEATRTYSRAWDVSGKRHLEQLESRLRRRLASGPSSHRWWHLS